MNPVARNLVLGSGLLALTALALWLARSAARPGARRGAGETAKSVAPAGAPIRLAAEARADVASEARAILPGVQATAARPDEPAPPAEVPELTVMGRVVDLEDAPVAGAEVFTQDETRPEGRLLARSDERGSFRGALPRTQSWQRFTVLADHHRAERIQVFDVGNLELELGTVRLAPGSEVAGRVIDEAGAAIADASVAWLPVAEFPDDPARARREGFGAFGNSGARDGLMDIGYAGDDDELAAETKSAADGRFRLRGLALGEGFVAAWKYGRSYGWSVIFEVRTRPSSELTIVLLPSATAATQIAGSVRDPAGASLAGVRVEGHWGWRSSSVLSASDGNFLLDEDWSEPVRLTAEDGARRWAPAVLVGVVPGTRGVELVLREPTWLTVRLLDEAERPIPWGLVRLGATRMETGGDGAVRFQVQAESFELEAFAPGFRTRTFGPFDPDKAGDELALHLSLGQAVRGRVTSGGQPVAGARLGLVRCDEPGFARESINAAPREDPFLVTGRVDLQGHDGTSGASGEFVLTLHDDGWHSLHVEAEGFPTQVFGPYSFVRDAGIEGLRLELERAGALEGRVRVAPGAKPRERLVGACNGWSFVRTAPVREDGSYLLENLAPGPYQVRVCAPPIAALQQLQIGEATGQPVTWDCRVSAGGTTQLDLDVSQEGSVVLEGRLTLTGLEPRTWEAVLLSIPTDAAFEGSMRATTALDDDGRFELALSRPGTYTLRLQGDSLVLEQAIDLVLGHNEWSYRSDLGRVRVRVAAWQGGPIRLRYRAEDAGGVGWSAQILFFSRGKQSDWVIAALPGAGRLESTTDWATRDGTWALVRELAVAHGAELVVDIP